MKTEEETTKLKYWIVIEDVVTWIDSELIKQDFFDVDFNGHFLIRIANTDGEYSVYNAMNGHGNNCYDEFKDKKVSILVPMESYASQSLSQQPVENGFIEYMRETRDQFSKYINGLEWNAPLRTQCESLLICFDQMRERLLTPQQPVSAGLRELINFIEKDFKWFVDNSPEHGVIPIILKKANELLSSDQKPSAGLRWVKASERTPDNDRSKPLFFKETLTNGSIVYRTGYYVCSSFYIDNNIPIRGEIEWLDENN